MTGTELLLNGLEQLKLTLSESTQPKLIEYVELIIKWNKVYNLTAIKNENEIIVRHILDSLAVVPYVTGDRILDVGSGAGLPGIPLALALPQKQFTLLDSNNKKIRFLTHVVATLEINNVEIVQERVEKYQPQHKFDCIITRAFSSLDDMITKTKHLYNKGGILLAMKGKYPAKELETVSEPARTYKLDVPFLDAQRHLVLIKGLLQAEFRF